MDIRGTLCYHLHQLSQAINRWGSSILTYLIAYLSNISIGSRFKAKGIPYFYRTPHSQITIGDRCSIWSSFKSNNIGSMCRSRICTMTPQARIAIGNNVGMSAVTITAHESIEIGDDTLIGAGTVIIDSDFHSLSQDINLRHNQAGTTRPVKIGRNVFIGTRCIILKGVEIGNNAIIGAGSVVSHDIPANSTAAGNPCIVRKQ